MVKINFDAFIPTTCWIAPDIPNARYSFGETEAPELPTWRYDSNQPASTTGLLADTSAPRVSARSKPICKFSFFSIPLPIETISADSNQYLPHPPLKGASEIDLTSQGLFEFQMD